MEAHISEEDGGIRLDRWFKRHYPAVPHALLEKYLRKKQVRVEGAKARASDRLAAGQRVSFPDAFSTAAAPPKPAAPAEAGAAQAWVIYHDAHLLALNKPAGLAVQGGSGQGERHVDAMLDGLRFGANARPKLVHRLDKDTSGILLLARDAKTAAELARRFAGKDIEKTYIALVRGVPKPRTGRISLPLAKLEAGKHSRERVEVEGEGKHAVTEYLVMESLAQKLAWVELKPITGRTHQLRVHMAAIGHPIIGDGKYGGKEAFMEGLNLPPRLHLHAARLTLPRWHGKTLALTAKLPPHMQESDALLGTGISS